MSAAGDPDPISSSLTSPASEDNPSSILLSAQTVLRLTTIIGGYILIRPLLDLFFRKLFASSSESSSQSESMIARTAATPAATLKVLADEVVRRDDDDDEEENDDREEHDEDNVNESRRSGRAMDSATGKGTGAAPRPMAEWGDSARRKQARFLEYWEAERARVAEEEDLEDVADLLED